MRLKRTIKKVLRKIIPKTEKNIYIAPNKKPLPVKDVVSVVIPTRNAGNEFSTLLKLLIEQKDVSELEIIVVDSGSTDNTLREAKDYGAKIICIEQSEFSHSYARNLGAENALGKYILFMTQDATPDSDHWIRDLVQPILLKQAVAVSCREEPRKDSDFYGRLSIWRHSRYIDILKYDRILSMPSSNKYRDLRKNSQLNDVACIILRSVFLDYKYRGDFAEDLDLGLRLIRSGFQLVLLSNTTVIHSHNRVAFYFLKRSFVDASTLKNIFGDYPLERKSASECMNQSIVLYAGAKQYVKELSKQPNKLLNIKTFFRWTDKFYSKQIKKFKKKSYEDFDILLKQTIPYDDDNICKYVNSIYINAEKKFVPDTKMLLSQQYLLINTVADYLLYTKESFGLHTIEMIEEMVIKNVGELLGVVLASYFPSNKDENCILNTYAKEFKKGV